MECYQINNLQKRPLPAMRAAWLLAALASASRWPSVSVSRPALAGVVVEDPTSTLYEISVYCQEESLGSS